MPTPGGKEDAYPSVGPRKHGPSYALHRGALDTRLEIRGTHFQGDHLSGSPWAWGSGAEGHPLVVKDRAVEDRRIRSYGRVA